jgi:hypothetical protein
VFAAPPAPLTVPPDAIFISKVPPIPEGMVRIPMAIAPMSYVLGVPDAQLSATALLNIVCKLALDAAEASTKTPLDAYAPNPFTLYPNPVMVYSL